jgi:hypothetical protein
MAAINAQESLRVFYQLFDCLGGCHVYAALGDHDQAMAWLEEGYEERFNPNVLLRPGFDPLRADRRFQELERRVGLSR